MEGGREGMEGGREMVKAKSLAEKQSARLRSQSRHL